MSRLDISGEGPGWITGADLDAGGLHAGTGQGIGCDISTA